nr:2-oxoglutarate-dependent dioxygenase DAO-like [Tanacetum cinerariifolium]
MAEMKAVVASLFDYPEEIKMRTVHVELGKGYVERNLASSFFEGFSIDDISLSGEFCDRIDASPHQREIIKKYIKAIRDLARLLGLKLMEGSVACSLPHNVDEIKAMVQKQIEEDKVRQLAIINLAYEYDNACTAKDELRNYEKCTDIPQEKHEDALRALNEEALGETTTVDEYLTEKQQQQLLLDEEALRETL